MRKVVPRFATTRRYYGLMIRMLILALAFGAIAVPDTFAATEKAMLHAREGVAALLRGKYDQAITSYDEAVEEGGLADLRLANIYNDRGVAKWRLKRTKEAIEDFNKAIELVPTYAVVYNNRGNALMDMGNPEVALADFERAVTLAPAYGAAFNNRGNALYTLGRYEEAREAYRRAVELMPTSPVPLNGRGRTATALGQPYAAVRVFARAIALNQKYADALANRGRAYASLGQHSDAISDFSQALAQSPDVAALHLERARSYAEVGKFKSALRDLERAMELAPAYGEAYAERGAIYIRLKNYKAALADLSRAVELKPGDAQVYVHRATALLESGVPEEALADVAHALEIKPESAEAFKVRGDIYDGMKQPEKASADYLAALKVDPTLAAARSAIRRLTGSAPAIEVEIIGARTEGWTLTRSPEGQIIATNPKFPKTRVTLEMYGKGDPKIVEWKVLQDQFRGIGLLRYQAGLDKKHENKPLEYVAIVDLWKSAVLAIEPYRWGEAEAQWEWREASVVVTDREGVASEVELRRVQPRRREYASDGWSYDSRRRDRGWERRRQRRTYRYPSSPRGGGLFDFLFGR